MFDYVMVATDCRECREALRLPQAREWAINFMLEAGRPDQVVDLLQSDHERLHGSASPAEQEHSMVSQGGDDYEEISFEELRTIAKTHGVEGAKVVAGQQSLLTWCKPLNMPSKIVGNGFDLGARWALMYPELAEDYLDGADAVFELMGLAKGSRDDLAEQITADMVGLLLRSGALTEEQAEELERQVEDEENE